LSSEKFQIPEKDIERLISEVDVNKDSQIDYNEFIEMMKNDLKVRLSLYKSNLVDLLIFRP